ncbi:uroporphyrinogen-III synthase [Gluconacetobacter entanii]|nr:uroporphyrinogen-III synthase [Gluconacetobacter entanii]
MPNRPHAPPSRDRAGVLVTRPPPGLAETMEATAAQGWRPVAAPMLDIVSCPLAPGGAAPPAAPPQAVVVTSSQAISAIALPDLVNIPCYAVGAATARRARAAGFVHVQVAPEGTAEGLGRMLLACVVPSAGALLLAMGRGYGMDLARGLRDAGFRVRRRVVYRVTRRRRLDARAGEMLRRGQAGAVLFYSPRTAQAFMEALTSALRMALVQVRAIVISARTAHVLDAAQWKSVEVAPTPDSAGMLACLGARG